MSRREPTVDARSSAGHLSRLVRRPVVWLYLIAVVAGSAFVIPWLATTPADPEVAVVAWVGGAIQAAALLLWGRLILPKRLAGVSTVLLSVLIGLTFAPAAAILIMNALEALGANRAIVAAPVEEPVKAAAVLIVLLLVRGTQRGPLDGLVVGFFVGFGFAVLEDVLYTYAAGDVGQAWLLVVSRLITQLGGHVLWTAIIGAALGYVIVSRERRWSLLLAAFAVSTLLHFTWDAAGVLLPGLASLTVTAVVIALTILTFFRVRRWSADLELRATLAPPATE